MITDQEIRNLIECPKRIHKRDPKNKYKIENNQRRCELILYQSHLKLQDSKKKKSLAGSNHFGQKKNIKFMVFIRQNQNFIENFSIGLVYKFSGFPNGLNLIRYNGPHDSKAIHHLKPHIHIMTEKDLNFSSLNPKPTELKITNKYNTLEEGLVTFFKDMQISNYQEYFPKLVQGRLF